MAFGVLGLMSAVMCALLFVIDALGDVNGISDKIPRFFAGKSISTCNIQKSFVLS